MITPYFTYEIDQHKKLNTLGDFENQTLSHIDATHAFQKFCKIRMNKKVIAILNAGIQPIYAESCEKMRSISYDHFKMAYATLKRKEKSK